jgi:ADP-L-glycero-D-manno-heptose 6-epimerase
MPMPSAGNSDHNWAASRVLVTGGAGFIGSALVWALNQRGCSDIVIADFDSGNAKRRNLIPLHFREYIPPESLLNKAASGSLRDFDFIFHLGACSSTTEMDEAYLRRNNYEYTKTLAAEAFRAGARFVYASSAATYGDGSAGMDDSAYESLPRLLPLNLYGESKHFFDLEAWKQGWLDRIVGLKYFNVFGPNEQHKGDMQSVVSKSYKQVRETGVIRLFKSYRPEFSDGEQKRDFLYVKDAVEMTLYLAAHPGAAGLFNIASGEAHTWNELAKAVFSAMGRKPRIEYVDMPEEMRARYQYFTQGNIGKLLRTGYSTPITPFRDAISDYVVNYLAPDKILGREDVEKGRKP